MLFGFQSSRPFWRRRRRRSAGERSRWHAAAATPAELGAWRRPPPATATAASYGHSRPAVVSGATAPPVSAPPPLPAAGIVLEPTARKGGTGDPSFDRHPLIEQLRPACQALSTAAFAASRRRARLILVTSPAADEGKSLTAVHLALGLCRVTDRPVLLVDGDGRTAGAARSLRWPPEPGLWDVLAGDLPLEGLIGHTGLDDLWFLPPGRRLGATPEIEACQRLPTVMRALLLREPSGLVVIDGPPLLAGVAAAALAACAGQVVLMVAAGCTSQQAIDDSLRRLGERDHLYAVLARSVPAATGPDAGPAGGRMR